MDNKPWSNFNPKYIDSWHTMCSYLGSFPAPLANFLISCFSKEKDLIMDPFSGRGTTSLEARLLNRDFIATDLNPIAIALTEAKNQDVEKEELIIRINELEKKYDNALYQPEANAQIGVMTI